MRTLKPTDERGMALAVAIFALVVIGALVAGAFYAGHLEQRIGRSSLYAAEAAQAADAGAALAMSDWDQYSLNNLPLNQPTSQVALVTDSAAGTRIKYTTTAARLNEQVYLIRSTGKRTDASGNVLSQHTVATLARLSYLSATAKAAVTVTKPVKFNGNAFSLIGNDSIPKGWDKDTLGNADPNCTKGADKAGIISATTTGAGTQDNDNLFGSPPQVSNDATVNSNFFNIFGDVTFDELKKNADIVIPETTPVQPAPTLSATAPYRCDTGNRMNWGEPWRTGSPKKACETYFPIIYASGSQIKMSGGARGQGLLLIEGDLEITGGFEFDGLIVAKGGIKISGNGNKVTGALLAQDVAIDDDNSISGNTTLQFSSCALTKAIKGAAFGEQLANRSWVQLY